MGMNAYTCMNANVFMPIIGIYAYMGIYYKGISFTYAYNMHFAYIGINVYIGKNAYIGIYALIGIYAYRDINANAHI